MDAILPSHQLNVLRIRRVPFEPDLEQNLSEEYIRSKCFKSGLKHSPNRKGTVYYGLELSGLHISTLNSFLRFAYLSICDLSNNYLTNISPISTCMNLVWLDIHNNHIEELPDEYFWSGLVSLKILNAHSNPLCTLVNVKNLSVCRTLEVVTMYDSPVSVHPFYRHCCVNKIQTLKALDHHVISDDEVIEGFLCPPKFTKFSFSLKVNLTPQIKDGMLGVLAVLRQVNSVQAKMSPCLFIQRVYRGYLCRKQVKRAFQVITEKAEMGRELSSGDIFNLTAVLNLPQLKVPSQKPSTTQSRQPYDTDRLPPIMPPTTPLTSHRYNRSSTVPTSSTMRIIFHRIANSHVLEEIQDAVNIVRSRKVPENEKKYIREIVDIFCGEVDEPRGKRKGDSLLKVGAAKSDDAASEDSFDESYVEIPVYRVPMEKNSQNVIVMKDKAAAFDHFEQNQIDGQLVRQADLDYHTSRRIETDIELRNKPEMKPVNMNAIPEKMAKEERVTQQLACLAAVERAYYERKLRQKKIDKASTVVASREVTMQAIRKQSTLVTKANESVGNVVRTERHLTHMLIDDINEKEKMGTEAAHQKRIEERLARRAKMESHRAVSDLRQRFCAISTSINRYDWANRQQGMLERSRAFIDQIQNAKIRAQLAATEQKRRRINELTAVNQLELRRAHEAIETNMENDMEEAKKRVTKVKEHRPERLPPQLPGPASQTVDGIVHASYNPIVGAFVGQAEPVVDRPYPAAPDNRVAPAEVLDINERWRVLAAVPEGRVGLHPVTAQIK